MRERVLILLLGLLAWAPARAQFLPTPTQTVVAPGTAITRTLAARAGDVVNVKDFGAIGDGVADDTAAINAAIAYARTNLYGDSKKGFRLLFPGGRYVVTSPINLTGLPFRGINVDGLGATIIGRTNGKAVIDAMGTAWLRLHGLTVYGDASARPSIGIQIGRVEHVAPGAEQSWNDVTVWGEFSLAAVYIFSAETNVYTDLHISNSYAGGSPTSCFGLVLDGINHFNVPSDFLTQTFSVDAYHSFNENTFVAPRVVAPYGCTPVWMSNTRRHRWIGGYVASGTGLPDGLGSPYGMMLYSHAADDQNTMLDLDVHFETGVLTDAILVTGPNPTPTLNGLRLKEQSSAVRRSILKLDTGITSVIAADVDFDFAGLGGGVLMFNEPSQWTVAGRFALPAGSSAWNLPDAQFTGFGSVGTRTTFWGDGSKLTLSSGQITLPSTLAVSQIANPASVSSIAVTAGSQYNVAGWCSSSGTNCHPELAGRFPTVTVAAPLGGGSQAVAAVSSMIWVGVLGQYFTSDFSGYLPSTTGSGYQVGDILTISGGTLLSGQAPLKFGVSAVDGTGAITKLNWNSGGDYSATPAEPALLTGGHGTGAQMSGLTWGVHTIAVTAPGAGYMTSPAVTIQATTIGNGGATAAASLGNASLTLDAGGAQVVLSEGGTQTTGGLAADTLRVTPATPASSSAACVIGRISVDAGYVYVCTATNTWKRAALSAW
jgi:hypothetical protein